MLWITQRVSIPESEIQWQAIKAQGAGGQNVNKTASAIHLRFDIQASSLPAFYKQRLLGLADQRVSAEGVIVIKAQRFRSQEKNLADARARLKALIVSAGATRKPRKPTRVSPAAKRKRVAEKTRRGQLKALRGRIERNERP